MSAAFQATLKGSPLKEQAISKFTPNILVVVFVTRVTNSGLTHLEVYYNDSITIQHRDTENFLFSWEKTYPLRYDDGRISSKGNVMQLALQHKQ